MSGFNIDSPIALDKALGLIKRLKSKFYFRRGSEQVALPDSVGRELGETIFASSMSPGSDIAAMDGFAVHSEDGYPLRIKGRAYAEDMPVTIGEGEAVAIATGAFMPDGADAVLKMEDAKTERGMLYGTNLKKWENVFRAGSDYRVGDRIFEKNHRIMPQSAALLYSLGIEWVPVYKKIRAGIISTGTEIHNGMIKNTNSVLVQGFMRELGCNPTFIGTVPDDYDRTKEMLLHACGNYDAVFTTGGVSVGERDYIADIIAEAGELVFHRVAIRPGKPIAAGIVNYKPVFALPGKPTGAFAALEIVVRSYFTDIPRATRELAVNEDIELQEKGFSYILFVKAGADRANTMGYGSSDMKLFKSQYETAIIASSPRSTIADGYVITDRDIKRGDIVKVHLFS
ncbi:MAG: molybdopterin molybdotransferase MoeA [Candidatus Methanoperedens sp.]|nr:molybdopterin molybdotransferase MoeA [Candidatus Methanoperedens sp.]